MHVINLFQLSAPTSILVNLIYIKMRTTFLDKIVGEIYQGIIGEIDIVGRNIQMMSFRGLLNVLQYHSGFTYASWTDYAH